MQRNCNTIDKGKTDETRNSMNILQQEKKGFIIKRQNQNTTLQSWSMDYGGSSTRLVRPGSTCLWLAWSEDLPWRSMTRTPTRQWTVVAARCPPPSWLSPICPCICLRQTLGRPSASSMWKLGPESCTNLLETKMEDCPGLKQGAILSTLFGMRSHFQKTLTLEFSNQNFITKSSPKAHPPICVVSAWR